MALAEYTGVAASGALDRTATASGVGLTASTGTTAATQQTSELVLTFLAVPPGETALGQATAGYTNVGEPGSNTGMHERVVTATGAYGLTCPLTFEAGWHGMVMTFRAKTLP